jgi:hypothetical protein
LIALYAKKNPSTMSFMIQAFANLATSGLQTPAERRNVIIANAGRKNLVSVDDPS